VVQLRNQFGQFLRQFVTDVNGAYAFTGLAPGTYQIVQSVPANYVAVAAFAGPGGTPLNATTIQVTTTGGISGNNNFLDRLLGPPPGANTISGFAIRDQNLNGNPNNDPGLAGMQITITNQFGTPLASVVTNATGIFTFTNVPSGTFTLTATPPLPLTSTNAIAGQGGTRLSANAISVTTTPGVTNYPGQLFLAGP
jgi:hypothetical protein